jgi:hypothetical protein
VSGTSQHLRKPALLVALIAIVGLGAASAMAARAASSAPKPFELVFTGEYAPNGDVEPWLVGAFTSKAPFCVSGSVTAAIAHHFECADGSGSLTLELMYSEWSILEGTGQYAALRGRGTFRSETLSGDPWDFSGPFRSTFQGIAAADVVAPTIAFASARASKVEGKKGIYTLLLGVAFRDDVEDNPVTYNVIVKRAKGAGVWLAQKSGEANGGIPLTLPVRLWNARVKALLIQATAMDPVGNASSLEAKVKLPA